MTAHSIPLVDHVSPALLAQVGGATGASSKITASQVLLVCALLVLTAILGGLAVLMIRRRLLAKEQPSMMSAGLMEGLRELRRSGRMSEEEYNLARQALSRRMRGDLAAQPRDTPPGGEGRASPPDAPTPPRQGSV